MKQIIRPQHQPSILSISYVPPHFVPNVLRVLTLVGISHEKGCKHFSSTSCASYAEEVTIVVVTPAFKSEHCCNNDNFRLDCGCQFRVASHSRWKRALQSIVSKLRRSNASECSRASNDLSTLPAYSAEYPTLPAYWDVIVELPSIKEPGELLGDVEPVYELDASSDQSTGHILQPGDITIPSTQGHQETPYNSYAPDLPPFTRSFHSFPSTNSKRVDRYSRTPGIRPFFSSELGNTAQNHIRRKPCPRLNTSLPMFPSDDLTGTTLNGSLDLDFAPDRNQNTSPSHVFGQSVRPSYFTHTGRRLQSVNRCNICGGLDHFFWQCNHNLTDSPAASFMQYPLMVWNINEPSPSWNSTHLPYRAVIGTGAGCDYPPASWAPHHETISPRYEPATPSNSFAKYYVPDTILPSPNSMPSSQISTIVPYHDVKFFDNCCTNATDALNQVGNEAIELGLLQGQHRTVQCAACGITYQGAHARGTLGRHQRHKHGLNGDKTYQCRYCSRVFLRSDARLKHERNQHSSVSGPATV